MAEPAAAFSPRMVDALVDAVLILEDEGRILYANPAFGHLLGWPVDRLFGEPFLNLVPDGLRAGYWAQINGLLDADPPRPGQAPRRMVLLHADGAEVPVDVGVFLVVPDAGSRLLIAVLWDVRDKIDIEGYQRVSDELLAFLASASGTPDVLVPHLLSVLASSMDFECATSWRWDDAADELHCEHVWRRDEGDFDAFLSASRDLTVRSGEGLAGLVVNADGFIWQADLAHSTQLYRHRAIVEDGLRTAFAFPIRTRDRLMGVIELFTRSQRQPDPPLIEAVAAICARLGQFIERSELEAQRAELIDLLVHAQRQQEFLLRANKALASAHDFRDAVERLGSVALPTLGDICLIDVVDPDGSLQRLAARHADPARQGATDELLGHPPDLRGVHPAARAVRTGRSQWSSDMDEAFMRETTQSSRHFELTRSLQFGSYVSVPLMIDGVAIGALTVVTAGADRVFGHEELVLAETLATQVASVIERTRRFDEQSRISHLLQSSLLPDQLGNLSGVRVAARHVAGSHEAEVGGDFYDAVVVSEGRLALVIGDVEGHDMTAATAMGELRSALRAYLLVTEDPGQVLALLDGFTSRQSKQRLASTCLVIMDTVSRTIAAASAGHPPPLTISGDDPARSLLVPPGPLLGVGDGRYPVATFALPAQGTLVLFTDGLIDHGRTDAPQRMAELTAMLEAFRSRDADALAESIVHTMGPAKPVADDLAVLVAQWSAD